MDAGTIFTLQDFMLHTKNVVYVLMVAILLGMTGFIWFLMERDDDEEDSDTPHGH